MAVVVTAVTYVVCCAALLGPYTSHYYSRLTSPRPGSLIVGTSRAAQGVQPRAVTAALADAAPSSSLYNFSFTMVQSPFGPSYLDAIRRKLAEPAGTAVSIVEVSPMAISENKRGMGPDVAEADGRGFLSKMHFVALDPNVEFPLRHHRTGFDLASCLQAWVAKTFRTRLHPDGWLEVIPPERSASRRRAAIAAKIQSFEDRSRKTQLSTVRMDALRETVRTLRARGPVFLVRLPTSELMLEAERSYMPDFSEIMAGLANAERAMYVDMTPRSGEYETTDGTHLERQSARRVSQKLGEIMRAALARTPE